MATEVFMPKMTDHMEAGEIIRWLVKEGDRVEQGQVIMEVMTDKVVADLEAPASGILKGIRPGAVDGAIIPVGETFAFIAEPDEEVPKLPPLVTQAAPAPEERLAAAEAAESPPLPEEPGQVLAAPAARRLAKELGVDLTRVRGSGPGGRIREEDVRAFVEAQKAQETVEEAGGVRASPLARRLARELGVDLAQVRGSGPGGRIREEDVRAFAEAQRAAQVAVTVASATAAIPAEWIELTPVQRLTGQRMLESVHHAPQFTLHVTVDTTNLLWLREALTERILAETGERPSVTALLVKIVAAALKEHPRANASFEGGRIRLYREINVGVAVGTDDGLVVPVIKGADHKGLAQVVRELKAFREKAQVMRFTNEDLSGGTFTISNLGMYGIERFEAIINPPQAAILAVGSIVKTPVGMPDDTVALRPRMSLTLTVDHRVLDGVQASRFLSAIKEKIEKPYFLL
ncbi:MAG: 2-oxo acid dehydrogenase subunit E2 [Anaerolineae bacterium]|nr:2-oxo acid dehydrogenase subunit E2 [Anaerolineae bacterium]MDW8072497.1 2-oxo acid dehydrogenase subunit E2 [Anaerolineae bacterium]